MDNEKHDVTYDTKAEAQAFIDGLNYPDNDHISWDGPTKKGTKWVVTVREFC